MQAYVGLLRAINVGGRNLVSMPDLRRMLEGLGFADVRTWLQSGNVIFSAANESDEALERRLEAEASKVLGLETHFMVRSDAELQKVIDVNPFPDEASRDPAHAVAVFLKHAPTASSVEALQAAIKGRETIQARGRELYVVYPDGIGRSQLTMTMIESKLSTRGTGRNWNTVLKLIEMTRT